MVLISGTFRLLILEFLGPEKQLLFHLKTIQTIFVTLLAGPQVSDRCHLGYLFLFYYQIPYHMAHHAMLFICVTSC